MMSDNELVGVKFRTTKAAGKVFKICEVDPAGIIWVCYKLTNNSWSKRIESYGTDWAKKYFEQGIWIKLT